MGFDGYSLRFASGVVVDRVTYPRGVVETAAAPKHVLTLHTGAPIEVDCACGDARYKGTQSPGALDFVAAGASGRWEDAGPAEVIRVTIAPSSLSEVATSMGIEAGMSALQPRFHIDDPQLNHVMLALACAAENANPGDAFYVNALSKALMGRLLLSGLNAGAPPPSRQQLSTKQKRLLIEYVETRLADRMSLSDLAKIAGISPSHFKALFRNTFGLPAHQYVIECRVARAARLIRRGGASIADVAAASGFAHQSHLARCMRKSMGIAPSTLARASR